MWVQVGGRTVRLASRRTPSQQSVELAVSEARWLVVVLAMLSGNGAPVANLKRLLTIALARRQPK